MPARPPVKRLRILKGTRRLEVYAGAGRELELKRSYPVQLGRNAAAAKQVEGDGATPVGEYFICAKNPRSKFFLSLCVSYPSAADAARGLRDGLISADEHRAILDALQDRRMPPQHTRLGGEIYIHGQGAADGRGTRGCIALDNADMQELYDGVALGTPVIIED